MLWNKTMDFDLAAQFGYIPTEIIQEVEALQEYDEVKGNIDEGNYMVKKTENKSQ